MQLTLVQVDLVPPAKDQRKLVIGKQVPGSLELDEELDTISTHWPATTPPNPQNLHIIVELPSGKRCVHWVSEISLTVLFFFAFFLSSVFPLIFAPRVSVYLPPHIFVICRTISAHPLHFSCRLMHVLHPFFIQTVISSPSTLS